MKSVIVQSANDIVVRVFSIKSHVSIVVKSLVLIPFDLRRAAFFTSFSLIRDKILMSVVFDVQTIDLGL
jgi:hypothetical protein